MTSLRFGLLGLLLFLALARKGSAQQIVCSRESNCDESFMEDSVESCCVTEGVRTYRPSPDSEQCIFCFAYGWVHEIAPDKQSAVAQPNINAAEGDIVSLTIYFVQNGPSNTDGFIFTIQTGGTATLGVDYQLVHAVPLTLVGTPMAVTVTLLSDGVAGEGSETIILTLMQSPGTPSYQNQILEYGTVMITVADSDFETGFRVSELTVAEGERTDLCLRTLGMPASDIITVTLTEGSAEENDVSVNGQVAITATDPEPCVVFTALADSLALEGQEMLTLSLSGPDNVIFRNSTVRIFINDGDVVIFEFGDPDKASKEASGVINVTVSQNIATAAPIDLTVTPTEFTDFSMSPFDPANPNNATPGVDFSTDVVTVTIPPGNGGAIFPIVIFDDKIQENSEQHFVGVLSFSGDSTGAALGSRTTIRLNIEDDDSLIVQFAELSHNASEGNTDVVYNLVITKSLESEQIYNVALRGTSNTASEGEDYSISSEVYLFPAEDENITVPVIITGDRRIELREDFIVTLRRQGGPPFVVDLTARQTTINIVDNDGNYMYVPAESTYFVMEGTTTEVSFVLLNPPAVGDGFEFDFNVIMSSGDGEATAGSDYVQISDTISGTSSTNGTITVNVTVLDDAVVELAEAFFITGQVVGENIPVVFDGRLEISITSDDVAVISYVQPEYSVLEGETVYVCLSPLVQELEAAITVALSAVAGSATEGEDFEAEDRFITFGPNMMLTSGSGVDSGSDNTTEMACITVVTARDILSENDETLFIVTEIMSNAELAEFQSSNTTTVTILDGTESLSIDFRCYSDSCGTMFLSADNARQCCIDLVDGITYDYGADLELCYSCEVLGWREENVYATENSRLQLFFGAVKGSVSRPYLFRVDISGKANISVISNVDLSNIVLAATKVGLEVQVPRSLAGARPLNRTATLHLTQLLPEAMADGQFVHPTKMTLHVIVPEVEFEYRSYTLRFPHSSFSVCLLYNNIEEGGYAQFEIKVSILNNAGGNFSLLESFKFTRSYGKSCQNISIPHSELDSFTDAVFTAEIVVPAEPVFELGAVSSASLTIEGIEPVCHDLVDPGNGRLVIMTGNEIGDTAAYICNFGYKLVGAVSLTCQDDGTWSDPPPVCKSVAFVLYMEPSQYSINKDDGNVAVCAELVVTGNVTGGDLQDTVVSIVSSATESAHMAFSASSSAALSSHSPDEASGRCASAGFDTCCDSNCSLGNCYCDADCHYYNDCCDDIQQICPGYVECVSLSIGNVDVPGLDAEQFTVSISTTYASAVIARGTAVVNVC